MRNLTNTEISQLEQQACACGNWADILVADNFDAKYVRNSVFSGKVTIGCFTLNIKEKSGMEIHTGIFNSNIHNCDIGDNCLVHSSRIANYNIGEDCRIENVNCLAVEGETAFGNGTVVHVLNESGGRDVKIYEQLSAQIAYILAFYRHRKQAIQAIERLIDDFAERQRSSKGVVGAHTTITNCKTLKNIKTGSYATLESVEKLHNGTICSDEENRTLIGCGVIANNFIVGKGSQIYDYVLIDNCFVGEACEIGKQYSAVDSLFFCNCQLFHGEACAIFAGPYTTSHHKSTLLIGCLFSFYNAGSGTNQSNHMYKLGPIHQGILERGSKTGSDSYMMLEVRTGAFSVVLGHHEKHFDTSSLPFSYIVNDENRSALIPAINLLTVGTQRDAKKWATRDKRKGNDHADSIIFDLFTPYTVQQIKKGYDLLSEMKAKQSQIHLYNNVKIKDVFVTKGVGIYRSAIIQYIGEQLIKRIQTEGFTQNLLKADGNDTQWIDMAGLVAPKSIIDNELNNIEQNKYTSVEALNDIFRDIQSDYNALQWNYVCRLTEQMLQKPYNEIDKSDLTALLDDYKACVESTKQSIVADASKEFDAPSKVGFGIDDKDCKDEDFKAVQGCAESNGIIQNIIADKNGKINEADTVIAILSK